MIADCVAVHLQLRSSKSGALYVFISGGTLFYFLKYEG